ncbi:MAG: hypothetical protein RIM84_05910 [Alphaproteobacteria bacterium]
MTDHLTRHTHSATQRLSYLTHRDDYAFVGVLGTLIVLWTLAMKLMVG